jgi:hypothetical protein
MNQSKLDSLCNEILTSIEVQEARLLNWGFVDVRSNLDTELPNILQGLHPFARALWDEAEQMGISPSDILKNLRERRLIFQGQDGLYRTRFAEAVRLLYLLRQRFSHDDWQTASRLVSDMKIQLERRRYPKRDVPVSGLLDELKAQKDLQISALHLETITRLLQEPDSALLSLAQFQKEAIFQQIRNLQMRRDCALVIGAGTGAGKTKAFYIPALAHIAEVLVSNNYAVKVLAIYPRVELLKDQLREAFSEVRKLDSLLKSHGKRAITLGAYYGDTPRAAKDFSGRFTPAGWEQTRDKSGWICPFFSCPNGSNHTLIWEQADLQQEMKANEQGQYGKYARLCCQSCNFETNAEQLLLTRERMIRQPPDILFTTTEMLNRRLSRPREHALFGIGTPTPPRLVLLDEIHTYEGLTGAQVAYLLRRWRHARGYDYQKSLCIVGLSATLTQAEEFFARLTGIPVYRVGYVFPRDRDLIEEGLEYNLILKGDPVSGTSLLSTSVQTAMLLGRVLDNDRNPVSRGAYGQRIFAFTDKLDVINRWYHIQYDAEKIKTLSQYREVDQTLSMDAQRQRNQMGQDWQICKLLGHELKAPLRLERTTSQDRGVSARADLVIATSTLEVGFNDPTVGAIIQHKAPRSLASFLQRKGRAGRVRRMRPWMVVVTSAYGRDRWAFQHAESLFNPLLPPMDLPTENYYVRKIQATYALMDWLSLELKKQAPYVDVWNLLSNNRGRYSHQQQQRQRQLVCESLNGILDGTRTQELEAHLQAALGIQDEMVIASLMWGEPRPLLFEVIPTILRQLETNWQRIDEGKQQPWKDFLSAQPMPEFVPSTLFSDLSLHEVRLRIPEGDSKSGDNQDGRDEFMGLAQALTDFAPGKASKRFARRYAIKEAHWLALPDDAQISRNALSLQYLKVDWDRIPKRINVGEDEYLVYRPLSYLLDMVPSEIRSTSDAQLIWKSHFEPKNQRIIPNAGDEGSNAGGTATQAIGTQLALSSDSKWKQFLPSMEAFTQLNGSWVEVTRLGIGVRVDTRYHNGAYRRRTLRFEDPVAIGQPAAIGFSLDVDALKFTFEPLNIQQLMEGSEWSKLYYHFGPHYFLHKLQNDTRLMEAGLSTFEIEWLWQLELSMLLAVAVSRQCELRTAAEEVQQNRQALADRTLRVIFQSQQVEDQDEDETGRLHQKLMDYLDEQAVQDALSDSEIVLWNSDDSGLPHWLGSCYASSLGATLFAAVTRLVADIEPDDLLMDVDGSCIWISEAIAGGVGLISKIADAIAQRPREFELQLLDTLQHCDRQQLSINLRAITTLIEKDDPDLKQAFWQARNKTDLLSLTHTRQLLTETLGVNGIPGTRQLIVALNTKFLRPSSEQDTDKLITTLVKHWELEQARLGCAIDLRVMSVVAREIDEVEQQVQQVLQRIGGVNVKVDESQVSNLLQSLLWLDCVDSCPDCIERWQPYQQPVRPSRAMLLTLLDPHAELVHYGEEGWQAQLEQRLATQYQAQLSCQQAELPECKQSLLASLATPIEIGFQYFFPFVERVERTGKQYVIHVVIRELAGY